VLNQTDALGNSTTYTYDAAGELIAVAAPARKVAAATGSTIDPFLGTTLGTPDHVFHLQRFGQVVTQTSSSVAVADPATGVVGAAGAGATLVTKNFYDIDGNLISTHRVGAAPDGSDIVRNRQVDYAGRVTSESQTSPPRSPAGRASRKLLSAAMPTI